MRANFVPPPLPTKNTKKIQFWRFFTPGFWLPSFTSYMYKNSHRHIRCAMTNFVRNIPTPDLPTCTQTVLAVIHRVFVLVRTYTYISGTGSGMRRPKTKTQANKQHTRHLFKHVGSGSPWNFLASRSLSMRRDDKEGAGIEQTRLWPAGVISTWYLYLVAD